MRHRVTRARAGSRRIRVLAIAGAAGMAFAAAGIIGPGVTAAQALPAVASPAIAVAGGNTVIAAATATFGLNFYWNEHGTNTWHQETIIVSKMIADATPAMGVIGNTIVIVAQGVDDSLDEYYQQSGATSWVFHQISGPNTTFSAPSLSPGIRSTIVAAEGPGNSLDYFTSVNRGVSWTSGIAAGRGTTYSAPSAAINGNTENIAAEGPGGSLDFYWAVTGSTGWTPETVAGPGTTASAPSMVANSPYVDIVTRDGTPNVRELDFYWALSGTTTWNAQQISPPCITLTNAYMIIDPAGGEVHVACDEQGGFPDEWDNFNGNPTWYGRSLANGHAVGAPPGITVNGGLINAAYVDVSGNLYFVWLDSGEGTNDANVETVDSSGLVV
jgi:hypothetical protein